MYFTKLIAITVLTFSASAMAAPTADFDVAAPINARNAEAGDIDWTANEARDVDVGDDMERANQTPAIDAVDDDNGTRAADVEVDFDPELVDDTPWGAAEEGESEVFARDAEPEAEAHLEARGFGCGFWKKDRYQCNRHVSSPQLEK